MPTLMPEQVRHVMQAYFYRNTLIPDNLVAGGENMEGKDFIWHLPVIDHYNQDGRIFEHARHSFPPLDLQTFCGDHGGVANGFFRVQPNGSRSQLAHAAGFPMPVD